MNSTQIQIPTNYVLVKVDPEFKYYHVGGKQTEIEVSSREIDHAHHVSISGVVIQVPQALVFNGPTIEERELDFFEVLTKFMNSDEGEALPVHPDDMAEYADLKRESVAYDVHIEVKPGDRVFFTYSSHYRASDIGGTVFTEDQGPLMLVKYDSLLFGQARHGNIKPINGFLIVEPLLADPDLVNNLIPLTKNTPDGPVIVQVPGYKWLATRRWSLGVVKHAARPVRRYLDFLPAGSDTDELKVGDVIIYNKLLSVAFESHYHQHLFNGNRVVRLHRKDVYGKFNKPVKKVRTDYTYSLWVQ